MTNALQATQPARPSRLDQFLAAGIARSEDQRERLLALGLDLEEARKVGDSAAKRLFGGDRSELTPQALIQFFGRPSLRRVERLAWDLVLWPEHRFECYVRDSGVEVGEVVLRERDDAIVLGPPPSSLEAARALFRPWHHTRRDVARVLGDTVHDEPGYPLESHDWKLEDGSVATFDFAHGLLLRVRAGEARPTPTSRSAPWWAFWRR